MVGGGSELLTATDLRVLGPSTLVAFVHTTMGISPGWGGAVRLAGVVGRKRALRLMMGEVRAQSGTGGAAGGRLGPARELESRTESPPWARGRHLSGLAGAQCQSKLHPQSCAAILTLLSAVPGGQGGPVRRGAGSKCWQCPCC